MPELNWEQILHGFRIVLGVQLILVAVLHFLNFKKGNYLLAILSLLVSSFFFWKLLLPYLNNGIGRYFLLFNRELLVPPILYLILYRTQKPITLHVLKKHLLIPLLFIICTIIAIAPNMERISNLGFILNLIMMFSNIIILFIYWKLGRRKLKELQTQLIPKAFLKYKILFYIVMVAYLNIYITGIISYFIQYQIFFTHYGDFSAGIVYTNTDSAYVNAIGWFFNVPYNFFIHYIAQYVIFLTAIFLFIFAFTELPFFKTYFLPKDIYNKNKEPKKGYILIEKLETLFNKEKPFKNYNNFTLEKCCNLLECNKKELQDSLKLYKDCTFSTYVNQKKIEEFKFLLTDKTNQIYDISSLAEMAGFKSKATFYRVFKQLEGITPKEYLQNKQN